MCWLSAEGEVCLPLLRDNFRAAAPENPPLLSWAPPAAIWAASRCATGVLDRSELPAFALCSVRNTRHSQKLEPTLPKCVQCINTGRANSSFQLSIYSLLRLNEEFMFLTYDHFIDLFLKQFMMSKNSVCCGTRGGYGLLVPSGGKKEDRQCWRDGLAMTGLGTGPGMRTGTGCLWPWHGNEVCMAVPDASTTLQTGCSLLEPEIKLHPFPTLPHICQIMPEFCNSLRFFEKKLNFPFSFSFIIIIFWRNEISHGRLWSMDYLPPDWAQILSSLGSKRTLSL